MTRYQLKTSLALAAAGLISSLVLASPASAYNGHGAHAGQAQDQGRSHQSHDQYRDWHAAQELRLKLHAALREHAALTVPALKSHHLELPDEPALMTAVEQNNLAVVEAIEQAYPGTSDHLLPLWRQHIADYLLYLDGTRSSDAAMREQARQGLVQFADQASTLLASTNPQLDKATVQQQFAVHGEQVMAIIDHLVAQDYDQVYALSHAAYEHMGMTADLLSLGRAQH